MRAQPVLLRAEVERSRMLQLPDDQADVVASTMKREQRHRIVSALQQLPAEQRQVIELNYFDGRSHKQIATTLNYPIGTVKTRAAGSAEAKARPRDGGPTSRSIFVAMGAAVTSTV